MSAPEIDCPPCPSCKAHAATLMESDAPGEDLGAEPPAAADLICALCGHMWRETRADVLAQAWRADVAWAAKRDASVVEPGGQG